MSLPTATPVLAVKNRKAMAKVRPRTRLFRALGAEDPPRLLEINGQTYRRIDVFKHDSWAATALYLGNGRRIICKFNRCQPILGFPMKWLGTLLAQREAAMLCRLKQLPGIPSLRGSVEVAGQQLGHAVARQYIAGQTLDYQRPLPENFFPQLERLLKGIHEHDVAYVDLHKRENVLVGDDGLPYLFDFQISFVLPAGRVGKLWPLRGLLRLLQRSDDYHFLKHFANCRPDLCGCTREQLADRRPWWIRLHRVFAQPLRTLRRRLLVWANFRSGRGYAESERFTEVGLRPIP